MASYAVGSPQPLSFEGVRCGVENETLLRLLSLFDCVKLSAHQVGCSVRGATDLVLSEFNKLI